MVVEKRRSHGWQAFGSYTFSRAYGLQASSGASAAGAQVSTVSPAASRLTFGRDPNDLTNARGRLPNDRPHMFRVMGSVDVPRTGFVVAANLQHFSGKPWAATARMCRCRRATQRILLEPRGSRRLSSQSLLDLRVSRTFASAALGRVELLLDVLNVLNDTAEEGAGDRQSVQPELRTAHRVHGSASGDGQREAEPRAVESQLSSSISLQGAGSRALSPLTRDRRETAMTKRTRTGMLSSWCSRRRLTWLRGRPCAGADGAIDAEPSVAQPAPQPAPSRPPRGSS